MDTLIPDEVHIYDHDDNIIEELAVNRSTKFVHSFPFIMYKGNLYSMWRVSRHNPLILRPVANFDDYFFPRS